MKNLFKIAATLLVAVGLMAGCSGHGSTAPEDGKSITISAESFDAAWDGTRKAVSSQLEIVEEEKEKGIFRAEAGISMDSWGDVIGIFITKGKQEGQFNVAVDSKTSYWIQLSGPDWEELLLNAIRNEFAVTPEVQQDSPATAAE